MADVQYSADAAVLNTDVNPRSPWEEVTHVYYKEDPDDYQVNWGHCHDPRGVLDPGQVYRLRRVVIHDWHTKLFLESDLGEIGGFNSVSFEPAALRVQP